MPGPTITLYTEVVLATAYDALLREQQAVELERDNFKADRDQYILQLVELRAERDALQQRLITLEAWPHCEECSFPLQDQGTPNGMVCLLCNCKAQRAAAQARIQVVSDMGAEDHKQALKAEATVTALRIGICSSLGHGPVEAMSNDDIIDLVRIQYNETMRFIDECRKADATVTALRTALAGLAEPIRSAQNFLRDNELHTEAVALGAYYKAALSTATEQGTHD